MNHSVGPKFAVGDKVILVRCRRYSAGQDTEVETEVTKVGRKYFWVRDAYHYQKKFYLDSGREVSDYPASCYVTTRSCVRKRSAARSFSMRSGRTA